MLDWGWDPNESSDFSDLSDEEESDADSQKVEQPKPADQEQAAAGNGMLLPEIYFGGIPRGGIHSHIPIEPFIYQEPETLPGDSWNTPGNLIKEYETEYQRERQRGGPGMQFWPYETVTEISVIDSVLYMLGGATSDLFAHSIETGYRTQKRVQLSHLTPG